MTTITTIFAIVATIATIALTAVFALTVAYHSTSYKNRPEWLENAHNAIDAIIWKLHNR